MKVFIIVAISVIAGLLLLHLYLIKPRLFERPDMSEFEKVMYAHRGLFDNESEAPENSMPAFEKAVKAGFGIELDIQLSKDGIPVVFHDFTLKRVCGVEGKVCDYTFDELQQFSLCGSSQKIPKFEDVLRLVDGKVPLIIEFKIEFLDTALCPIADHILSGYKGLYCMESFNPLGLYWYRLNRREVPRGQLADNFLKTEEYKDSTGKDRLMYIALQNLMGNCLGRPDFIAYNHIYPDKMSRKILDKIFKIPMAAWTIKSEESLDCARKDFDIFIFDSFIPGESMT